MASSSEAAWSGPGAEEAGGGPRKRKGRRGAKVLQAEQTTGAEASVTSPLGGIPSTVGLECTRVQTQRGGSGEDSSQHNCNDGVANRNLVTRCSRSNPAHPPCQLALGTSPRRSCQPHSSDKNIEAQSGPQG